MTGTMRAIVVAQPGPREELQISELAIPHPAPGQVLIRVKAFGLNRSKLHFRQGLATSGTFPRVPAMRRRGSSRRRQAPSSLRAPRSSP
jgi:NADPH:quinone reductase-like Zn-dependent oxidoreductase